MSTLSTIRPANDPAAIELAAWGASLHADIKASHTLGADLHGAGVTRTAVEIELATSLAILFFGHGFKSRLQGHSSDVVDTANAGKAAGNIVIAIACWSAVTLGPASIAASVDAYLGFDEQLTWLTGDPHAQFGPAATSGIRDMVNSGGDIGACATKMKQEFNSVFHYYKTGVGASTRTAILGWLAAAWDERHVVQLGNSASKL